MLTTFLLSAVAHELLMAVVTKTIKCAPAKPPSLSFVKILICSNVETDCIFFALQLIQIPMVAVARSLGIKQKKLLGNAMICWRCPFLSI
ncbi:hypothetical protein BGW80DRAFT_1338152, partial [Lactifluus volemus]